MQYTNIKSHINNNNKSKFDNSNINIYKYPKIGDQLPVHESVTHIQIKIGHIQIQMIDPASNIQIHEQITQQLFLLLNFLNEASLLREICSVLEQLVEMNQIFLSNLQVFVDFVEFLF